MYSLTTTQTTQILEDRTCRGPVVSSIEFLREDYQPCPMTRINVTRGMTLFPHDLSGEFVEQWKRFSAHSSGSPTSSPETVH